MCSHQIFSFRPGSTNSPVAGCLEKALTAFTWSREGIGMGLLNQSKSHDGVMDSNSVNNSILHPNNSIDSTNISMPSTASNSTNNPYTAKIIHNMNKSSNYSSSAIPMNTVTSYISTNSDIGFGSTSSMRTKYDDSRLSLLSTVDEIAEDKYRTKSPLEFMFRWLRFVFLWLRCSVLLIANFASISRTRSPFIRNSRTILKLNPYKRMILYIIIFLLLMYLFIHYFLKLARESADEDPFLDPHQDANIRVADVWLQLPCTCVILKILLAKDFILLDKQE